MEWIGSPDPGAPVDTSEVAARLRVLDFKPRTYATAEL